MGYISGTSRNQTMLMNYEDLVGEEEMVRVIDRFVEVCPLKEMGFTGITPAETGRPGYPPEAMTKLFVYGYENGIRSSRKLEKETHRNVEAMWLMNGLTPDHKTISEFRRQNIRPLQKLFRDFVQLCKSWELIGGELIAVDGTKIKASNSKKRNISRKQLNEKIARLDEQIKKYLAEIEEADSKAESKEGSAPKTIEELLARKELYEGYIKELDTTGENEISQTDPDARLMANNLGGLSVAYNVQSAVDAKAHIIVEYDVIKNAADQGQLGNMAKKVKKRFKLKRFKMIADKGYYQGEDLVRLKKLKVAAIVSRPKPSNIKGQPEEFHSDKFQYNEKSDTYTCPAGETFFAHSPKKAARRNFFNKDACRNCEHAGICAKGERGYRAVARSKYAKIYEETDKRTMENMATYKLRQQLVEHPFGTIKHTMNGSYFLLRTRRKVRCEIALLFLGYNLKRAFNTLGFKGIMERLEAVFLRFLRFLSLIQKFEIFYGQFANNCKLAAA